MSIKKLKFKVSTEQQLKESLVETVINNSTMGDADHTLLHIQDPHYKFYQITQRGNNVATCYGKIGSGGICDDKFYSSGVAAAAAANRLLLSKLKKGYEEPIPLNQVVTPKAKKVATKKMTDEGLAKLDIFLSTLK